MAGSETFRRIATYCKNIGVDYLTVYAFSTENWKRPEDEVGAIMKLLDKYLREAVATMARDRIRMRVFGDISCLSPELQRLVAETEEISSHYEGFQANICINYGGRDEIINAARRYAEDYAAGRAGALTEESFGAYLYSAGIPDPGSAHPPRRGAEDFQFSPVAVRYSEFYFTDVLWPGLYRRRA